MASRLGAADSPLATFRLAEQGAAVVTPPASSGTGGSGNMFVGRAKSDGTVEYKRKRR